MAKRLSIVIPVYNLENYIENTVNSCLRQDIPDSDYEIILIDDGSKDGSTEIVEALELPNIKVSGYGENRGKGAAVKHGVLEADGDVVMFTDADLAYGTEVIGEVFETFELIPETQIVVGSRNISEDGYAGYTTLRRIMSRTYIKLLCLVGGFELTDSQCGCKAFRADAAKDIFSRLEVSGFAFDFEAILWAGELGYDITELGVKIINHRESKVNVIRDTFRMLRDLHRIKRSVRRRASGGNKA